MGAVGAYLESSAKLMAVKEMLKNFTKKGDDDTSEIHAIVAVNGFTEERFNLSEIKELLDLINRRAIERIP